ncbi:hypothetical protein [Acaryochloris marina]|uniref:Uncharacterized protein n=1 Tax=Acaryochloris marina (strain MBIC 11017) TaxID=329726 RepID=B0CAZ8_ACAM1|nr:hypothetical protein [Acaryochloris marina]ABW25488.1 conserved hypothetical protein [Acaryochloris marina MBIC11017]BDM80375.1 hypothetical protein AM10699_32430 [Acaryochloris marina MBIC10699]
MADLSRDIQACLQQILHQSEQMFDASVDMLDQTLSQIEQGVEEYVEPIVKEIEQGLDEVLDPIIVDLIAFEHELEEMASPLTQRLYPLFDQQPACVGCRHYYGKTYGETFLVCGMHPYGASTNSCPDWESC